MEKAGYTSDASFYIEEYGRKTLVYGKDYWIAVIARDNVGNYNDCFIAICGPVQTYGNMNSENLKGSTSKVNAELLAETKKSESLENSTSNASSEFLAKTEKSGDVENSTLNTDSGSLTTVKNQESLKDSASNMSFGFLAGNEKYEQMEEKSRSEFIINLIPEMNKTSMRLVDADLLDKQVAESSESYPEIKSSPGFHIIYAAAGIFLITFRSNFKRKPRRKI
jgi:hypothetical protein